MIKIQPLINQDRAIKQGLSVMVYALVYNEHIICRVYGRPDNFELFSNAINAEIAKLQKRGHTSLQWAKEKNESYEVFTTDEVKFGQTSEITAEELEVQKAMENAKKKFAANRYAHRRKETLELRRRIFEERAYA